MEPRPNELKTTQPNSEALRQCPESRQRSRFWIEPLEERIAPDKKGSQYGGSEPPPQY